MNQNNRNPTTRQHFSRNPNESFQDTNTNDRNQQTNSNAQESVSQHREGTQNNNTVCLRCRQTGHKSNNCFEVLCRNCKEIGHTQGQCPQSSALRMVHFVNCEHCDQAKGDQEPSSTKKNEQGNL